MPPIKKWDDYFYPNTDVLQNKHGIRDAAQLRELEEDVALIRIAEMLHDNPVEGTFDRAHMQAIHRRIFGDVYPWAGEIRVGPPPGQYMTKGGPSPESIRFGNYTADDGYGYQYFPVGDPMLEHFDRQTAILTQNTDYHSMSATEFAQAIADPWGEINAAHIFREGNTRTQVVFFTYFARANGHDLDHGRFRSDAAYRAKFNAARFAAINPAKSDLLAETIAAIIDAPKTTPVDAATSPSAPDDYQPHYVASAKDNETSPRKRRKTPKPPPSTGGRVWVAAHKRNGRNVKGHWRNT